MQIVIIIVLSVILYVVSLYVNAKYMIQPEKPPKPVRAAGMAETAFGIMVVGSIAFTDSHAFLAFILLLSLFWICIAVSLYKANKIGRTICLFLSILRIPTVIGIPFSLFSIYKLYFTQDSKDFFNKKSKREPVA